jgi:hypothetical protein
LVPVQTSGKKICFEARIALYDDLYQLV